MNIAVCVKNAIDESELRVDSSGRPELRGAPTKMSTFDRNAVEEAVRIKEAKGGSVTVLSLGGPETKKTIKEALAMGGDRGVAVTGEASSLDALATSYYLSRAVQKTGPFELVICSEGASDTYQGLVGPMMGEWLGIPFVGFARRVEVGDGTVRCEQAFEDRVEVSEAKLPAVLSVVSEVNEPRYPTLLQIMQASKKPMEEVPVGSLGDSDAPEARVRVSDVTVQATNRKKVIFEGAPEDASRQLIEALKKEGAIRE